MARGWESKEVESQINSAEAAQTASNEHRRTLDEIERESKLHGLMLSRTRVMNDLQCACNARYRQQLQQALSFLDAQIAALSENCSA